MFNLIFDLQFQSIHFIMSAIIVIILVVKNKIKIKRYKNQGIHFWIFAYIFGLSTFLAYLFHLRTVFEKFPFLTL